ncbi:MAG: HlyD family secretion protein [Candidatus Binatota bacterium]|nr:HlyD family secretion protein [Candidatus Binatota bacterium]
MSANRGTTITLFAIGSLAAAVAIVGRSGPADRAAAVPRVVASRGDLEVTLAEPGTLQAARSVTLASEIRSNRAKIVGLLADGSWMKPGDEVIRFDRTPFEEDRTKAATEARDAEAAADRLEQERKLQLAKVEEELESARYRTKLAALQLDSFEKGTGALNVREAEVRAAESRSELDRARRDLDDIQQMFARGFVSDGELARQRAKVEEVERQHGLERDRLRATREVTFPRDLERARAEVAEAKDAVARSETVLYHTHEFYDAAAEVAARKVEATSAALRSAEEELEKAVVRAPIAGFLILQDIPLESGRRKPQVGDSVWSGQPIATIPDLGQVIALTRIREVDLHRIRQGLSGAVAVEAYPELELHGTIDFIGSLAEASDDSPWKFFGVRLALDRSDARLRPGMSVRVSFLLDAAHDVVLVPLDAVFEEGGRDVCFVRRGADAWEQPVVLGLRNETHVEVRRGVSPGEELMLGRPTSGVRRSPPAEPSA